MKFLLHILSFASNYFLPRMYFKYYALVFFFFFKIEWLELLAEESHQPEEDNNKNSSLSVEERLIRVITEITHGEEDCMTEEQILREVKTIIPNIRKKPSNLPTCCCSSGSQN